VKIITASHEIILAKNRMPKEMQAAPNGILARTLRIIYKKRGIGSARGNKFKVRPHIKGKQIKSDNIPGVRENRLNDF